MRPLALALTLALTLTLTLTLSLSLTLTLTRCGVRPSEPRVGPRVRGVAGGQAAGHTGAQRRHQPQRGRQGGAVHPGLEPCTCYTHAMLYRCLGAMHMLYTCHAHRRSSSRRLRAHGMCIPWRVHRMCIACCIACSPYAHSMCITCVCIACAQRVNMCMTGGLRADSRHQPHRPLRPSAAATALALQG